MASKTGDEGDDVDMDAQTRLQTVTLAMKQQADELLLANRLDKALTLYRELLMHLTRSQVKLLQERELVISCRMNVLAALSKANRWSSVVKEAVETLAVFAELTKECEEQDRQNRVLSRAHYFRGFAYLKLGSLQQSQQDFRRAMELDPEDGTIVEDYKELQTALQAEQKVKQCLATSMKFFQAGNYKSAVEACICALRESQLLQKTELTGLIHGNLAAIYVKMKDDAKAIDHYKRTMLLTRCGDKPTVAQNERVYDILDSLAGCYSRKRDYSSALSVVEDQIRLFPSCPDRKDREAMMYLNGGRICYTMGRYPQAEEHLEKGQSVAIAASNQLYVALNCAYWLSKAYAKSGKTEKAMETLNIAIPAVEKDITDEITTELLEKLLLERLDLLEPDTNDAGTENSSFKGHLRESQLWETLGYFEGKRQIYGHVRAAEVLVRLLSKKEEAGNDERRLEMMRALALVDCVNIGKLSTSEATSFLELALVKVDLMVAHSPTDRRRAKDLLVKLLRDLELPGGADPSCRQQLRDSALLKVVDVWYHDTEEESDEDVRMILEEAIDVLRTHTGKGEDEAASKVKLMVALLPKIGRWKAVRGDIVGAEEVLEESVDLLRCAADPSSDHLYESLVGLCVVQIRLGMLDEATQIMKEIEALPIAQKATEVSIIKDRLQAAVAMARKEKEKKKTQANRTEKSLLFEKQQSATGHSFLCGIGQVWQWCGPLIACVAAAAVALFFA